MDEGRSPATNQMLVTGLFNDRPSAERAYESITSRGYSGDDVNLVMSDDTRKRHFTPAGTETELGNKAAKGAGVGGAIGGVVGAIAAVVATGAAVVIPGLGLMVAGRSPLRLQVASQRGDWRPDRRPRGSPNPGRTCEVLRGRHQERRDPLRWASRRVTPRTPRYSNATGRPTKASTSIAEECRRGARDRAPRRLEPRRSRRSLRCVAAPQRVTRCQVATARPRDIHHAVPTDQDS